MDDERVFLRHGTDRYLSRLMDENHEWCRVQKEVIQYFKTCQGVHDVNKCINSTLFYIKYGASFDVHTAFRAVCRKGKGYNCEVVTQKEGYLTFLIKNEM